MKNPVMVLGIGNTLFTDDGAGIYAVRQAQSRWTGGGVDFAEAEIGGHDLIHYLVGYQAVLVVDVAVTGQFEPGELYLVDAGTMPAGLSGRAHGAGVGTALALARTLNLPLPGRLEFMAIEAQDIVTPGEVPTTPVADAIPVAAEEILRLAQAMAEEVRGVCMN